MESAGERSGPDLFEALVARFCFLAVTAYPDHHDALADEPPRDVAILATDYGGQRHRVVRATAREAALAILGQEPLLRCKGPCARVKPCTEFARDAGRATGRCQRCKVCERERVRKYARQKRGQDGEKLPRGYTHPRPKRDQPVQEILPFAAPDS